MVSNNFPSLETTGSSVGDIFVVLCMITTLLLSFYLFFLNHNNGKELCFFYSKTYILSFIYSDLRNPMPYAAHKTQTPLILLKLLYSSNPPFLSLAMIWLSNKNKFCITPSFLLYYFNLNIYFQFHTTKPYVNSLSSFLLLFFL